MQAIISTLSLFMLLLLLPNSYAQKVDKKLLIHDGKTQREYYMHRLTPVGSSANVISRYHKNYKLYSTDTITAGEIYSGTIGNTKGKWVQFFGFTNAKGYTNMSESYVLLGSLKDVEAEAKLKDTARYEAHQAAFKERLLERILPKLILMGLVLTLLHFLTLRWRSEFRGMRGLCLGLIALGAVISFISLLFIPLIGIGLALIAVGVLGFWISITRLAGFLSFFYFILIVLMIGFNAIRKMSAFDWLLA